MCWCVYLEVYDKECFFEWPMYTRFLDDHYAKYDWTSWVLQPCISEKLTELHCISSVFFSFRKDGYTNDIHWLDCVYIGVRKPHPGCNRHDPDDMKHVLASRIPKSKKPFICHDCMLGEHPKLYILYTNIINICIFAHIYIHILNISKTNPSHLGWSWCEVF